MIRHVLWRVSQLLVLLAVVVAAGIANSFVVLASPFGQGVFGADVPFGSGTSMTISLDSTVQLDVNTPSSGTFTGSGSHDITVTSTDVVGYRLYIYALGSSNLTNGSETIAASGNTAPAGLATDTWGYNTSGSTSNFIGITTSPVTLKDATGPHKSGDTTTVTFGAKVSTTKGAGDYTATVVYTAVGKSE